MGIIAESIVSYAQPLIDESDGSLESMNQAMTMAQMCWNFAITPEDQRDAAIEKMKLAINMPDEEFVDFREVFINPMIRRHIEMFPGLHGRSEKKPRFDDDLFYDKMFYDEAPNDESSPVESKNRGLGRNSPCPCGSGRKYKKCCGSRR